MGMGAETCAGGGSDIGRGRERTPTEPVPWALGVYVFEATTSEHRRDPRAGADGGGEEVEDVGDGLLADDELLDAVVGLGDLVGESLDFVAAGVDRFGEGVGMVLGGGGAGVAEVVELGGVVAAGGLEVVEVVLD